MIRVSLKTKLIRAIKNVAFASVAFFVIGALLKSDGPKLDLSKIYELVKDTVAFFSAFLGPVFAYVLFNDWRGEHIEKKLEADSESIFKAIQEIYLKLYEVRMSICTKATLEETEGLRVNMSMELLTVDMMRVRNYIKLLKEENDCALNFIQQANDIVDSLNKVNNEFYDIQGAFTMNHKSKREYEFLSPIFENTKELTKNASKIDQLNDVCKELQVKNA
ncbi:hypothetical protein [Acinetobacter larvae]|uniref:Uncharacterized protein n=1 Tax=Acinetobacter larvae TaxID=1789224 RepID=A0A1B2LZE8_9GAMM|nr:hypothetical protein [Acinetobacter larvae]AOA58316.1 hypothetical protein BFG52_08060 [Acinetobacter larvae]